MAAFQSLDPNTQLSAILALFGYGEFAMTEPMTARERAKLLHHELADLVEDWDTVDGSIKIGGTIERAILADRAAERERLAQSGDVEGLAIELAGVWHGITDPEAKSALGAEPEALRAARHVQAKIAATAEAARIEARDAIADIAETKMTGELDFNDIRALRPDELEKKT